jgi:hypothetical protein
MTSNGSKYVAVVFALLVAYFSYQWWFNQNRVVKRRLGEIAATLSAPPHEADLERVARLARLRQYLADDIKVRGGRSEPELSSREAVMAAAAGWRPEGGGDVALVDVDVKIEGETARAYATAELTTRNARDELADPRLPGGHAFPGQARRVGCQRGGAEGSRDGGGAGTATITPVIIHAAPGFLCIVTKIVFCDCTPSSDSTAALSVTFLLATPPLTSSGVTPLIVN